MAAARQFTSHPATLPDLPGRPLLGDAVRRGDAVPREVCGGYAVDNGLVGPRRQAYDLIYRAAIRLAKPELEGAIRLLGIRITGLTGEEGEQLPLFDNGESERMKRFEKALDYIHERFGDGAITRGTEVEKSQEED